MVAILDGQADLYAVDSASGATTRLTDTPETEYTLWLQPAGHGIAYLSAATLDDSGSLHGATLWTQQGQEAPRRAFDTPEATELLHFAWSMGWVDDTLILEASFENSTEPVIAYHVILSLNLNGEAQVLKEGFFNNFTYATTAVDNIVLLRDTDTGRELALWDGTNEPQFIQPTTKVSQITLAPDGKRALTCPEGSLNDPQQLAMLSLPDGQATPLGEAFCDAPLLPMHWSADSRYVALHQSSVVTPNYPTLIFSAQGQQVTQLDNFYMFLRWQGPALLYLEQHGAMFQEMRYDTDTDTVTPIGPPFPEGVLEFQYVNS